MSKPEESIDLTGGASNQGEEGGMESTDEWDVVDETLDSDAEGDDNEVTEDVKVTSNKSQEGTTANTKETEPGEEESPKSQRRATRAAPGRKMPTRSSSTSKVTEPTQSENVKVVEESSNVVSGTENVKSKTPVKARGRKRVTRGAGKNKAAASGANETAEDKSDVSNDTETAEGAEKMDTEIAESSEPVQNKEEKMETSEADVEKKPKLPESDTPVAVNNVTQNTEKVEEKTVKVESSKTSPGKSAAAAEEIIVIDSNSEGESTGKNVVKQNSATTAGKVEECKTKVADTTKVKVAVEKPVTTGTKTVMQIKAPVQQQVELKFGNHPILKKAPVEVVIPKLEMKDLTREDVIMAFRHSQSFHVDFPNRPQKSGSAKITYWLSNVNRQKIICKILAKLKTLGLMLECPKLIQGMIRTFQTNRDALKTAVGNVPVIWPSKFQSASSVQSPKNVQSTSKVQPGKNVQSAGKVQPGKNVQSAGKVQPGKNVQSAGKVQPGKNVQSPGKPQSANQKNQSPGKPQSANQKNQSPGKPQSANRGLAKGKVLEANKANQKSNQGVNPIERSMFVENIPQKVNEKRLRKLFPTSKRACLPKNPGGSTMGWAVMEFHTRAAMLDTIEKNKNLTINNCKIKLSQIKKGFDRRIPNTPKMRLWLWGIKPGDKGNLFRIQLDRRLNKFKTFGQKQRMRGLNVGPIIGSRNMGLGMGVPNMLGPNIGSVLGVPNMSSRMGGHVRMGPNANRSGFGGPNMGGMSRMEKNMAQNFGSLGNSPTLQNRMSRQNLFSDNLGGGQTGSRGGRDRSLEDRKRFGSQSSDRERRFSLDRDFGPSRSIDRELEMIRSQDFNRSRFDEDRDLMRRRERELLSYDRGNTRDFDNTAGRDFERRGRESDRSRSFDRGNDREFDRGYSGPAMGNIQDLLGIGDRARSRERTDQSHNDRRQRKLSTEMVNSPESDNDAGFRRKKDNPNFQKSLSEKLGVVLSNERHGVQDDKAMVLLLQTALNAMQKQPSPEHSPERSRPPRKQSPSPRRRNRGRNKRKNPFEDNFARDKRQQDSSQGSRWESSAFDKSNFQGGMGSSNVTGTLQTGFNRGETSQTGFGGDRTSQTGFNRGETSQTGFGGDRTSQTGFGRSETLQTGFGGDRTSQTGFGRGETLQTGFGGDRTSQTGFGRSETLQTGFGGDRTSQTGFGRGETLHTGFGGDGTSQTGFGRSETLQTGFGGDRTSQTGFGRGETLQTGFGGDGTSQTGFGSGGKQQRRSRWGHNNKNKKKKTSQNFGGTGNTGIGGGTKFQNQGNVLPQLMDTYRPSVSTTSTSAMPTVSQGSQYRAPDYGVQAYSQPNKAYTQPKTYTQPNQAYTQPKAYTEPNHAYTQPNQAYTQPNQAYTLPDPNYTLRNQAYTQQNQAYTRPSQDYTPPNPTYPQSLFPAATKSYQHSTRDYYSSSRF